MYTHSGGYRFRIRIHPNGYGLPLGRAVNIDVFSTPGEYDEDLEWPVEVQFTVEMLNCVGGSNWIVTSDTGRWGKNRKTYLLSINYSSKQNCYIKHCKLHDYFAMIATISRFPAMYFTSTPCMFQTFHILLIFCLFVITDFYSS